MVKALVSREERVKRITDALKQGQRSLETLCDLAHYAPRSFHIFLKSHKIELPEDTIPYKTRPKIDTLIEEGLSKVEIGKRVGLSRQSIHEYVVFSGQQEVWKEKRALSKKPRESKQREEMNCRLVRVLEARLHDVVEREYGWAYRKALEYVSRQGVSATLFESAAIVYQNYERTVSEGRKASFEKLGEGTNLYPPSVRRILRFAGIESMHWVNKLYSISPETKQAMHRAFDLDMSCPDIAYFLCVTARNVQSSFENRRRKRDTRPKITRHVFASPRALSLAQASQIYEADDAEFEFQDMRELTGFEDDRIEYALAQRGRLEEEIIQDLRILANDSSIDKPYMAWNQ